MSDELKISIIDYGVGNVHNLAKAFSHCGATPAITEEISEIENSDAIILPGVGAFEAGMKGLAVRNLTETIRKFAKSGKPVLGICLGAQILFDKGFEFGEHLGLGLLSGNIVTLKQQDDIKLPHIGWNAVKKPENASWENSIFNDVPDLADVYFVHSFVFEPNDKNIILAETKYGDQTFVSAVQKNNIIGVQFHPEISGQVGLKIIENFISRISSKK